MTKETFIDSARKCCENGRRLLDEAELLEFETPPSTRYYLSMIAQEEAAKAFLLYLVSIMAIPWTPYLLRATRDHQCKQLVGIVLEYISPDTDEFLRRMEAWRSENTRQLPSIVTDATNLLYHEKMRRWEPESWLWEEDPDYDKSAAKVAYGKRDREKQRALYVELGRNGQVGATPQRVTKAQANNEYGRGRRFEECVCDLVEGRPHTSWDLDRIADCFKALFSQNAFMT